MPFVKVNEYFINLDQIIYVQDTGKELVVCFGRGKEDSKQIVVTKGTREASSLTTALVNACV